MNDEYNVKNYSDKDLYNILDLVNPTDRELEAKLNNMIWKYDNIGGESGEKLSKFFTDIYEHFFEVDEEEEEEEEILYKEEEKKEENVEKEELDEKKNENLDYNFQLEYSKGKLNPLLQQTVKRIVSIDSQYRDNKATMSTDYTFNLSDPLKDVVNLRLYSIQIPYTWYTINTNYGSNFFMIKGNTSGINNGNHDYKIEVPVGNYTAADLITAVNVSLQSLKTNELYTDASFGETNITYDPANSKSSINLDLTKNYNENQYNLVFQNWTTPNSLTRSGSIASFLGFNRQTYNIDKIYSNLTTLLLQSQTALADENESIYLLDETNNYFTIYNYKSNSTLDKEFITDASTNFTILDTIEIRLSGLALNTTYSRNELVTELNNQLESNTKLVNSRITRVDETNSEIKGYNKSHFELEIRLNRNLTNNEINKKIAIVFPNDTRIWIGTTSAFVFDNIGYEMSNIVSETRSSLDKFVISTNPSIKVECIKENFDLSRNDIDIILDNSPLAGYLLSEYLQKINEKIIENNINNIFRISTTNVSINSDSRFSLKIDLTKTFTNSHFVLNLSDTIIGELIDSSGDNIPISSTFQHRFATNKTFTTTNKSILKLQANSENIRSSLNYDVLPTVSKTYTDISELLEDINENFISFSDANGNQILNGSNISYIQDGNEFQVTLVLNINVIITQNDFKVIFEDSGASETWSTSDQNNSWAYNFKIGQREYNLNDYSVSNTSYSEILGNQVIGSDFLNLDSTNNKITLSPVEISEGGEGIYTSDNLNTDIIEITPGSYTRGELVKSINTAYSTKTLSNGTLLSIVSDTSTGLDFTKIRINVNRTYRAKDYKVVFYDPSSFVTYAIGTNIVTNTTWDATLGWILGFRISTEYNLSEYTSAITGNSNIRTIVGDNVVSVSIYNYFLIILDDFNQNHLNDGVVTTTSKQTSMPLASYSVRSEQRADPVTGKSITSTIKKNGQQMTQKEIYAAQEIINDQVNAQDSVNVISTKTSLKNKGVQYFSSGPFARNVFALLPLKIAGLPNNSIYVDYGGTLQNQERTYFGPVNINRMSVKLMNDRGEIVDLNGANWSFSFVCEQLYQQQKI
tara:strand:+ start:4526 stop:7798 length:3273 start_codon:yes stop_codon:yes gene_type:complete